MVCVFIGDRDGQEFRVVRHEAHFRLLQKPAAQGHKVASAALGEPETLCAECHSAPQPETALTSARCWIKAVTASTSTPGLPRNLRAKGFAGL